MHETHEKLKDIGIAGFWNGIPSLFRYRPALEYRPVTDFYGIPAEGYIEVKIEGNDDSFEKPGLPFDLLFSLYFTVAYVWAF